MKRPNKDVFVRFSHPLGLFRIPKRRVSYPKIALALGPNSGPDMLRSRIKNSLLIEAKQRGVDMKKLLERRRGEVGLQVSASALTSPDFDL